MQILQLEVSLKLELQIGRLAHFDHSSSADVRHKEIHCNVLTVHKEVHDFSDFSRHPVSVQVRVVLQKKDGDAR